MNSNHVQAVQKIPASLDKVWELFSSAKNLQEITPKEMKFKILSTDYTDKIFKGQIIEYKVSPLFGISLYWKTEIVDVEDHHSFIDEQVKGPYRLWHHEHYFREIDGGVEMTDQVTYKNPLGFLGSIANVLIVKNKLRKIFQFRYQKVEEIFGRWPGQQMNITVT